MPSHIIANEFQYPSLIKHSALPIASVLIADFLFTQRADAALSTTCSQSSSWERKTRSQEPSISTPRASHSLEPPSHSYILNFDFYFRGAPTRFLPAGQKIFFFHLFSPIPSIVYFYLSFYFHSRLNVLFYFTSTEVLLPAAYGYGPLLKQY